jgi:hypothetical protein
MPRGHLDLHARNTAPWDAGTSLDGTVVVVGTDLAVLDGQGEGNPGGGEGGHAGVDARALVEGEAEHTDGLWCCCVIVEDEVVCEEMCARVVGSFKYRPSLGVESVWREEGSCKESDQESTTTYRSHTRGTSRY